MSKALPFPKLQRLRASTGWRFEGNKFTDFEPDNNVEVTETVNSRLPLLEFELLFLKYKNQDLILDMGWVPDCDPKGEFKLSVIKNKDWENQEYICKTRSKGKIVAAVEQTMLRISQENGDYNVEAKNVALQPLRFHSGWEVVKNDFFEQLDPANEMRVEGLPNQDGWQLLHEDLLHLQVYNNTQTQIRLGWFPAHDKQGAFRILATTDEYFDPPLVNYSTRDKAEAVEIIEHLIKEIHLLKPLRK